jgi:ribokinase
VTVIADEFKESGGGKGSNQAVAAAKFGASVRLIARVGADRYGRDALAMYRKLGMDTGSVRIDRTIHSGISVILIDQDGNNLIAVVPGANLNLSRKDLDSAEDVLRSSRLVGFQLENDHETVFYGIRRAHDLGVTTFLDPGPAIKLPESLYTCIDIIKPNEAEASILTGIRVIDTQSAERAGKWLVDRGVKQAIITLGREGAVSATRERCVHYPAPKVRAVDSTGAGDVFSGGLLFRLSQGRPMEESIQFALFAASLSTTRLGVIESIPELKEVVALLKSAEGKR